MGEAQRPSPPPPRKDTAGLLSADRQKVTLSVGHTWAGGSTGPSPACLISHYTHIPPPSTGSSLRGGETQRGWGGGQREPADRSPSISGYMLGTSAFQKLFWGWEVPEESEGPVSRRREIESRTSERANGGRSRETIKMWAMYKSSRELIKMQDFQKLVVTAPGPHL